LHGEVAASGDAKGSEQAEEDTDLALGIEVIRACVPIRKMRIRSAESAPRTAVMTLSETGSRIRRARAPNKASSMPLKAVTTRIRFSQSP
jgi:hypothetical protein